MARVTVGEPPRRLKITGPVVLRRIQVGALKARQELAGRDFVWMILLPDDEPELVR